jgi:hypothetical protein
MPLDRNDPATFQQFAGQPQYLGGGNFAPTRTQMAQNQMGGGGWPGRFDYGPGENPRAGFSARQSPMEAGMRTGFRNMIPGVSMGVDRPEAGSGMNTWLKKLLGGIPYLGAAMFQPFFAGQRAAEARGQNEFLYPEPESLFNRGMTTAGAGLRFAPGGQGVDLARNIYSGVQGARGIADFMGFNIPNFASGVGGMMGRSIFDRMSQGGPPSTPSQYPFFGESPTAGGEWGREGGGVGEGFTTQNWAQPMVPSSFDYERG